jgi:predicted outer membrane repeat protein
VTTPYLSFAIDHSLVACKADDMTKDLATVYGPIWANFFTAATPSSNIGGAFYFEAVTSASTIDSDLNTYKNCYTAGQGGIFSLPSGLTMTDDGSVFKQNAALQGGVIYCNGCSVTFTSSSFADLLSSYGSIGYFLNDAVATFTSTDKMQHGKAGG